MRIKKAEPEEGAVGTRVEGARGKAEEEAVGVKAVVGADEVTSPPATGAKLEPPDAVSVVGISLLGIEDGLKLGAAIGTEVAAIGTEVGAVDGLKLGAAIGTKVAAIGTEVGAVDGLKLGAAIGTEVAAIGTEVGAVDGLKLGAAIGSEVAAIGTEVGDAIGG